MANTISLMFNAPARQVLRKLHRLTYRTFKTGGQIPLLREGGGTARLVADAIDDTLQNRVSPEEAAYIAEIEGLRLRMEASDEEVEVVDFGAGTSNDRRSASEMSVGHAVRARLGDICHSASKTARWTLLMMKLVRALQPKNCLELGTCVGISAAYQAAALELNRRGTLFTIEGSPETAAIAQSNLRKLRLDRARITVGRFSDVLPGILEEAGTIDFAFIDGHHDYGATLEYFAQIKPFLSSNAVVLFDDIAWSPGMASAWNEITTDQSVRASVDFFNMGLVSLEQGPKRNFRIAVA